MVKTERYQGESCLQDEGKGDYQKKDKNHKEYIVLQDESYEGTQVRNSKKIIGKRKKTEKDKEECLGENKKRKP